MIYNVQGLQKGSYEDLCEIEVYGRVIAEGVVLESCAEA